MDAEQKKLAIAVGGALRAARKEAGFTLRELAELTGLSQPFLSQAENGQAMPSLMNLHRLAQEMGTTAHALLERGQRTTTSLIRRHQGRRLDLSEGAEVICLSTGSRMMGPNEVLAAPHSQAPAPAEHQGEEFVYLIEGALRVEVGPETFTLDTGDTLYYAATIPHRWFNDTSAPARFLITSSPPTF